MFCDICGSKSFSIYITKRYGNLCFYCNRMVNTMFIPDGFKLYELLPKNFYEDHYNSSNLPKLWNMFDYRLKYTIHMLRKRYGTLIANDWYWGGVNQYRGWRPTDCTVGAKFSQHKYGRAIDLKTPRTARKKASDIREDILRDPFHEDFKYITCVEMGVSWLHFDVRDHDKKTYGILEVWP